ncbi:metalloregulator ArsR/SmtB family transcription factor [Streptomyces sp. PTM05]|uniref:Metalloregulator ArsR/SmtB family transcription factor n=1 Tax=Streptantibioticus parmotrematis TaxID=2873249 RepID=A0ABS7QSD9_9ACTN|nr:metalloregulator ArsR/SmtB family transcription factor [Streptantibioticus parmotrematis]MBY8886093.1 metalloregulator ArsR/SmtB family transcription factor [Streptantibioticus parmotrematis]
MHQQRTTLHPDTVQRAAETLGLLAASVRLHIVHSLLEADLDVSRIADRVDATLPTVSQHLTKLKLAGIVRRHRQGRHHVYSLTDRRIGAIAELALTTATTTEPDHHDSPGIGRAVNNGWQKGATDR